MERWRIRIMAPELVLLSDKSLVQGFIAKRIYYCTNYSLELHTSNL